MIPLAAYYSTGCNGSSTRPLDDSSRIMRTLCICIKTPDCLEERIRSRRVGRGPARPTLRSRRCKKRNRDDRKKKKKSAERNTEKWIRPIKGKAKRVQTRASYHQLLLLCPVLRPPRNPRFFGCRNQQCVWRVCLYGVLFWKFEGLSQPADFNLFALLNFVYDDDRDNETLRLRLRLSAGRVAE